MLELILWERSGIIKSLYKITAKGRDARHLFRSLHTLCHGFELHHFCKLHGKFQHTLVRSRIIVSNDAHIQLHDIQFQFTERRHRRITGTKVIQFHSRAAVVEFLDRLRDLLRIVRIRGLRQLNVEKGMIDPVTVDDGDHFFHQILHFKITSGDIHGNRNHPHAIILPLL